MHTMPYIQNFLFMLSYETLLSKHGNYGDRLSTIPNLSSDRGLSDLDDGKQRFRAENLDDN